MAVWIVVLLALVLVAGYWLGRYVQAGKNIDQMVDEFVKRIARDDDDEWQWPKNPAK